MVGSVYFITCIVMGAERLDADSAILYQWFKDGEMVAEQTTETFSFTFLTSSDVGSYTCQATVMSSLLSAPITSTSTAFIRELQRQSQVQVINHNIAPLHRRRNRGGYSPQYFRKGGRAPLNIVTIQTF